LKPYHPNDIADMVGGQLLGGAQQPVTGASIDSRTVEQGDLFVAIETESADGHRFVPQAFTKGARAAIITRKQAHIHFRDWDVYSLIVVDDTVRALQDWAAAHRKSVTAPVCAITGSNGKTTTKEFTASAMSPVGSILKTEGTLNNHLGVPMSILKIEESHRAAVIEIGMNHAGEIAELGRIAEPTLGVITNTGAAHLEFFDSMDALIDAKWELAEALSGERAMVLNGDDAGLVSRARRHDGPIRWFGLDGTGDWYASDLESHADGCWSFVVGGTRVRLGVPGKHMIGNALAAMCAADYLGVPPAESGPLVAGTQSAGRRMGVRMIDGVRVLDDAYNANPASTRAALEALASLDGRHVAVLGGMYELGDDAARLHLEVGRVAGELGVTLVAIGPLASYIAEGARESGGDVVEAASHDEANAWLTENIRTGDTVLVKGSRGERMELVVEALMERLGRNEPT
jgi:UDP-N-acetylmuramoyl-tripeptide--D-alanyl-D-alanine ligase